MANRRFQAHPLTTLLCLPLFPVELLFPSSLSQGLLVAVHLTTSQGETIQYCQSSTENNDVDEYWWWYLQRWFDKNIFNFTFEKLRFTSQLTGSHKAASWAIRAVTSRTNWDNGYQFNKTIRFGHVWIIHSYLNMSAWLQPVVMMFPQSAPSCTKGKALEAGCRLGSFVGTCSLRDLRTCSSDWTRMCPCIYIYITTYYLLYTVHCTYNTIFC